jgi:hypothetical protein
VGDVLVVEYVSGVEGQLFSERVEMMSVDASQVGAPPVEL